MKKLKSIFNKILDRAFFYDIEVVHGIFLVTFIPFFSNKAIIFTHNSPKALADFLNEEVKLLIGFNNKNYDDIILREGLANLFHPGRLKAASDNIINTMKREEVYDTSHLPKLNFFTVDVMNYLFSSLNRRPLKLVAANLGFSNVLDSPVDFNQKEYSKEEIRKLTLYNINDVLALKFVFLKTWKKFDLKIQLSEAAKMDVMNASDTKFAKKQINEHFTRLGMSQDDIQNAGPDEPTVIKIKDIINPRVRFETKPFQVFLDNIKKETSESLKDKKRTKWTKFAVTPELVLQFGLGGK